MRFLSVLLCLAAITVLVPQIATAGKVVSLKGRDGHRKYSPRQRQSEEKRGSLLSPLVCMDSSVAAKSKPAKGSQFLSILLPWLYFMAISVNIPNLPKFVNWAINKGDTNVSPKSAAVYGTLSGVDSFFTCLVVNLVGCMSDSFGRRPFMLYSSLGLGFAYFLTLSARTPSMFYFAAMIDGLTSCMFSQAQSYVTDMNNSSEDRQSNSVVLGRFQGIAVGMAFLFGIPLGAVLGAKFSLRTPLYFSIGICTLNALLIAFCLPETPVVPRKKIKWSNANPIGAIMMLGRNKRLVAASVAYFFVNIAQVGVQINWINYLQFRFGWSAAKSGSTMLVVGFSVAILPKIFIRVLGSTNAITFTLLLHALSIVGLGRARSEVAVYMAMAFFSAGACILPMLLGFLTDEVSADEVGALQGAADTVRTVSSVISAPLMSRVFARMLSSEGGRVPRPEAALYAASLFSFVGFLLFSVGSAQAKGGKGVEKKGGGVEGVAVTGGMGVHSLVEVARRTGTAAASSA